MSKPFDIVRVGHGIAAGQASIDEVAEFVHHLMPDAVKQVNELFSPRQLVKPDRTTERLPPEKRQLSSYRTRLGAILEYALSTQIDQSIEKRFGPDLRLTFAVAHEYPDFYVRDAVLGRRIGIEMKAVDADSEEQSARFDVLSTLIQGEKDIVVLVGWEWHKTKLLNGTDCEYPVIFAYVVVPAIELVNERDQSVVLRGGRIERDRILVPKKNAPGELTEDKGNAGKILRLIHMTRRKDPFKLSLHINNYLKFVDKITSRARGV